MNIEQINNQSKNRSKLILPVNELKQKQADIKKQYIKKLTETTNYYSDYKINNTPELTTKYTNSLSELNGLDKQVVTMNDELLTNMSKVSTSLIMVDSETKDLQSTYENLKKYTSFDSLDPSSKRMLLDYLKIYNNKRIFFWIKTIVIGIIIYLLMIREHKNIYFLYLFIGVILLYIIMGIYNYYKSNVTMPPSVGVQTQKSCSSCGSTTYGCCPDGVTTSNSDRSNCQSL